MTFFGVFLGHPMKIGIAQINPVVGDFPGNAKRILAAYRECLDAARGAVDSRIGKFESGL